MISVQCDFCFKEYKVKLTLAGKRVKCKECGHAIRIPRPGEEEAPFAEDEFAFSGSQSAPPPRLPARQTDTRKSAGQATHKKKQASSAGSDSTLLLVLGGAGGVLLLMLVVGIAFPLLGGLLSLLMIGLGGMVSGGAGIWIVVIAFQDDTLQGVLTLLAPFYIVYYAITRWDTSKFAFLTYVAGVAVCLCGLGLGAFLISKGVESLQKATRAQLNADVGKPIDLGIRGDTVLGDFGGISDDSESNTGPTETTDTLDVTAPKSDASKTPASVPSSKPLLGPVNITRFWKLRDAKPVRAELVELADTTIKLRLDDGSARDVLLDDLDVRHFTSLMQLEFLSLPSSITLEGR